MMLMIKKGKTLNKQAFSGSRKGGRGQKKGSLSLFVGENGH